MTPAHVTAAIVRWLRLEAAAHSVRSLTGRLDESGPRSAHREIERVLDASRPVRHCTDRERAALRARYWPQQPSYREYDMRVAARNGGTVVIRTRSSRLPTDSEVARQLGLTCARSARTLIERARLKVRSALQDDEQREAVCA